jgi:nicotinamide mononucleotide transporter
MTALLRVETVFVTVFGYPMSYLEFAGTVFNLWSVWLVARKSILTWPVGIAGVILFAILFYQIQLYADLVEQAYFLVTGFYGWWIWGRAGGGGDKAVTITRSGAAGVTGSLAIVAVGTAAMGYLLARIDGYLPVLFPQPATFPYLDAFTTVMSFVATILMARKKIECWHLWIAVDLIGVGLYFAKGVVFVSLLYLVFLVLATRGLLTWRRDLP